MKPSAEQTRIGYYKSTKNHSYHSANDGVIGHLGCHSG